MGGVGYDLRLIRENKKIKNHKFILQDFKQFCGGSKPLQSDECDFYHSYS